MSVSVKMREAVRGGSMVRKMFEEGLRLKQQFGADQVFDYSLGNPDLEPPPKFKGEIIRLMQADSPGIHGYMPNAGIPPVREKLAAYLSGQHGVKIGPGNVLMTVGAAGALNVALKTVADFGDEVLVLAPYFMEYNFYADNHGARVTVAQTDAAFRPDPVKISAAITSKTRAFLINSPNNPTGVVYTEGELKTIGDILRAKSKELGRPVVLVADEPYRKIVYDGLTVPSVFQAYENSVVVSSFSKDLSLAGERVGFLCANPALKDCEEFMSAATLCNRILGFVNAPALMQRAVSEMLEDQVDVGVYQERVRTLSRGLREIGYKVSETQGTFYLFPESPVPDDFGFVETMKKELILAVPGSGFSRPGHFRLSLCLDAEKIKRSLPGFERAIKNVKK
jgi:aspartate aminotransferase